MCSDTRDNPAARLDDVMASWVGKEVASAVTESGLAHLGTYRLPLRMELAGARPNHRPGASRWAFVPVSAICRLLCMVNDLPQRVSAPQPSPAAQEKNPVQRINELAQRGVTTPVQDTYTREGPDHFPWFTCRSVTSTRSETITVVGKGTSKQKARTEAARLLLEAVTGKRGAAPVAAATGTPELSLIHQRGHGAAPTIPEPEPAA
ncbi:putative dsRNA-binding protein [Streptomyces sp. TRM64462]|uniref:putative dsRNA-binding protein n=1 Tax=Streptomyces sp. TRM64462 TaxID=2741726 RepID=UPI001586B9D3|nr:putative dsRNA-binding protein [Streptomyces sp. TRM64462]